MKPLQTLLMALLVTGATAHGALYTVKSGNLNASIPDGNPNGISSTLNVSIMDTVISDVNVYINVSGGANGDLYAYLSYENGSVVLLNRIGKTSSNPYGSSTAGFGSGSEWYNFKLDDAGATDIHGYSGGSPATGTYQADRRTADPQSVLDTSSRGSSLGSFNGSSPNGAWTIFFADMAGGGGSTPSTLVSWGLEITTVPEPISVALGIFGGIFIVVIIARSRRVRRRLRLWRVGFVHWVDAV
jgi:subtilisin-like proprotein convertase family protein